MELLYVLERIRFPLLDRIMLLFTHLGSSVVFLFVAVIFLWCIDKRKGYYFAVVGLGGTVLNQFLKLWFRVPRPWVLDENFTIVEAAREGASGYSFPSGHSQSAVSTYSAIALLTKRRWLRALAIAITVIVPFTRMYLGVHTPADVLVASAIALLLVFILKPIVLGTADGLKWILGITLLVSAGYLCFTKFYGFPENVDVICLNSGAENALCLFGAMVGLFAAYIVDRKWINFTTKAVWWAQVLKVTLGLLVLLAIKEILKTPLNYLMGDEIGRIVRYAFVTFTAGALWPLSFCWFSKLGIKG